MSDLTFALVGPTATGKSALAIELAPMFDAEIVAVDSMTIYRRMDIGTAKPTPAERARVPHHMIDVADPAERFTVARFQQLAHDAVAGVRARGHAPFIVGGSGLYFRAIVDDLAFPPEDPAVRARLSEEDLPVLVERLRASDPEASAFLDARNKRRLVRALEVIEVTGRPFSSFRDAWERFSDVRVAGLLLDPGELERRIRARLRAQLDAGFADEVRALLADGALDAVTARQAIPYTQGIALVEGRITEEGFIEEGTRANRRLARRQLAWFRRDPRVRWFDASDVARALAELKAYYAGAS